MPTDPARKLTRFVSVRFPGFVWTIAAFQGWIIVKYILGLDQIWKNELLSPFCSFLVHLIFELGKAIQELHDIFLAVARTLFFRPNPLTLLEWLIY